MGALAESFGVRQGIKYRRPIKDALLMALKLDPAFLDGSADRALGRWYYKVPGLFGGSNKQSEAHLRKSLTYNPNSVISHFFLAETLDDRAARRRRGRRRRLRSTLRPIPTGRPRIAIQGTGQAPAARSSLTRTLTTKNTKNTETTFQIQLLLSSTGIYKRILRVLRVLRG